MTSNKWSLLALEAHRLALKLGYRAEPELKKASDVEFIRAWRDFLIENRDDEAFVLRVNHSDCLPDLLKWLLALQGALSDVEPKTH